MNALHFTETDGPDVINHNMSVRETYYTNLSSGIPADCFSCAQTLADKGDVIEERKAGVPTGSRWTAA